LINVDNHEVELTRRGVEVAKLGIENYNRKIEEEIRAKKRKEKIKEIIDVASKVVGTVIAILSVYLACRPK
jgi:sugar phosphate isomerase/epimerase